MVENRSRLFNFCLTSGRNLFQDVLELETSPALVFNKLLNSDYYRTLSESEKESYLSLINQNTFSALESICNILKNSNFLTHEIYFKCVSSLRTIGHILSKKGAFGKSFLENIMRDFEEDGNTFYFAFYILPLRSSEFHLI